MLLLILDSQTVDFTDLFASIYRVIQFLRLSWNELCPWNMKEFHMSTCEILSYFVGDAFHFYRTETDYSSVLLHRLNSLSFNTWWPMAPWSFSHHLNVNVGLGSQGTPESRRRLDSSANWSLAALHSFSRLRHLFCRYVILFVVKISGSRFLLSFHI